MLHHYFSFRHPVKPPDFQIIRTAELDDYRGFEADPPDTGAYAALQSWGCSDGNPQPPRQL